ncbi:toll/interleukin-1 receptor domain-containing protein [Nocardioides halotolerans]|uniref:toll/interleukin-1 receptor domain-containing protein n=1 Tax=Nocardioides halotolerans TaxID=433660 RepID=UPI00040599C9|nr:TIR domain-containing protein [Nocardioides halotolerans]
MSRVFVSCSYRDRAVGAEVAGLVRALGHEPADDRDDAHGTAWWNEVVGRIEASDAFIAVASPAYADAHACRLAARHAAATGLPVVRVDLDERAVADCHPVVASAVGVPFAPEDPATAVRLGQALDGSPLEDPPPSTGAARAPSAVDTAFTAVDTGVGAVTLLGAVGLVLVGLSILGHPEAATDQHHGTGARSEATRSADALLAEVRSADSPGLPADSCRAGAGAVTCTNPASGIDTVVLTPYPTPAALYEGYTAEVEARSGRPFGANTGNCSTWATEGEVGWNLDKEHRADFSVAQHVGGGLDPVRESAGRVFCTDQKKVMRLAWTQDPGLLVTATGQPSEQVVGWWAGVHLDLACAALDVGVGSGCP